MDLIGYRLRKRLVALGFSQEVEWTQNVQPLCDLAMFWREFASVVLDNGMKNQVAAGIWQRVRPAALHLDRIAGNDAIDALRARLAGASDDLLSTSTS